VVGDDGDGALPLRCASSSIPMRTSPSNRSRLPLASAATRVTIAVTVRQVIRSSFATTGAGACAASQAHCSSNDLVNRAPPRAQGTAATITPRSGHLTRGASASRYAWTAPRSSVRQRRRPSRGHSPGTDAHSENSGPADPGSDAPWPPPPPPRHRGPPPRSPPARHRAAAFIPWRCARHLPACRL
jgi:hypothetical protein